MLKSRRLKTFLLGSAILIACGLAYCISIGRGPDFEITMTREVPSKLNVMYIDQVISSLKTWPAWFHSGSTADEIDFRGIPYPKSIQKLETHGLIRLGMDAQMGLDDRFDIRLLVEEYSPGDRLRMRVLSDSKHKLDSLFDDIEWEIELSPQGTGSLIRGTVSAHTRNWRSRIFGKLCPNVILNQIFYPDLFLLADINNPNVIYPDRESQHGGM